MYIAMNSKKCSNNTLIYPTYLKDMLEYLEAYEWCLEICI